jgi:hypothetical protein
MNTELYDSDPKYRALIDAYRAKLDAATERMLVETCPKCYFMDESVGKMNAYRCYSSHKCPAYERDHK